MRAANFASVVENIQALPMEDKEELVFLLNKYMIESRREEIVRNYQKSKKKKHQRFSNNIKELKAGLNG